MTTVSMYFKHASELREVKVKHQFQAVIDDGRIEFCDNAVEMFSRLEVQFSIQGGSPCLRVRPSCCGVDIGVGVNVPSQFYDAVNCKPAGYFRSFNFNLCCANGWFYAL